VVGVEALRRLVGTVVVWVGVGIALVVETEGMGTRGGVVVVVPDAVVRPAGWSTNVPGSSRYATRPTTTTATLTST
jgi:hypothetical protein